MPPLLDDVRQAVRAAIDVWRTTTPRRGRESAGASFTARKTRRDVRVELRVPLDHGGIQALDETHDFPTNMEAGAVGRAILARLLEIQRAARLDATFDEVAAGVG